MKIYRQGDVLLKQIKVIPKNLKPVLVKARRLVLAEGEATGHSHTISELDGSVSIDEQGRMFLRTEAGCELVHQEHGLIFIEPGNYEVVRQREYAPGAIRNVQD